MTLNEGDEPHSSALQIHQNSALEKRDGYKCQLSEVCQVDSAEDDGSHIVLVSKLI
jgi:hypothetical protein